MKIRIKELNEDSDLVEVQNFLFKQIKKEFGYGYVPQYHKDIIDINDYYIDPIRNTFFVAIDKKTNEIVGTIGLRAYDKDFEEFRNIYSNQSTASIWRLFVDEKYRRCGLATLLYNIAEDFAYKNNFEGIYLHTHKNLEGALDFWNKMGFEVTIDTHNELETVHMHKRIYGLGISNQLAMYKHAIKL